MIERVILIILVVASCRRPAGPEKSLRDFIRYRFEANQSRSVLLGLVDGPLKAELEGLSPEAFNALLNTNHLKQKKLKINRKQCHTPTKCFLTYTLFYAEQKNGAPLRELEIKRIAEMWSREGKWKVSNIDGIKSYIDNKKAIEIPSHP